MGAERVPTAVPGGGPVSPPVPAPRAGGSQSGCEIPAAHSPSRPGGGAGAARLAAADSSESRIDRASDDSAPSSSPAVGSDSPGSKTAGKPRAAAAGNPSGDPNSSRSTTAMGRQAGTASTAAAAPSQAGAPAAAAATDFSAALARSLLAQSLAATAATFPASAATADASPGKASVQCEAGESSESPTKHATTDPASTALTLLEQALAGALVGIPSLPAVASAPGAGASGAAAEKPGAAASSTKSSAAALSVLLTPNTGSDPKPGATAAALTGGSGAAAGPAGTASAAAAALTAAVQLPSGSPVGLQHGISERSTSALASPVGTGAWTEELGAKLTWMAHQGIESASLRLSPEHLGPLQVTISVHDGQASVWFGAAQPDTRTALQQSLPQLRQLFASQGLTLADAGVSREPPRGQHRQPLTRAAAPVAAVGAVNLDGTPRTAGAGGLGLLDTYA